MSAYRQGQGPAGDRAGMLLTCQHPHSSQSQVLMVLPGMDTVLQPGELVPGLQPAGQLAQGPWKCKLSQRQTDRSHPSPKPPVGWARGGSHRMLMPWGGTSANLWAGRGTLGRKAGQVCGKKEPSQLPSWASPGGNTQAAALAGLRGPFCPHVSWEREGVLDRGLEKVSP